jgi:hypothetical protein
MQYYPKSQIKTDLFSNGGDFSRSDNGLPYVGSYWKTSDGSVFSGKTPNDKPSIPLLPISEPVEQTPLNTTTEWTVNYPSKIVNKTPGQVPKQHLFTPTQEDLSLGQVSRYFTKKSNQKVYFEISKDTFKQLSTKSNQILFQLYTPITMIWRLEGNDDEVFEANLNTARDIQNKQQLPGFVNSFKGMFVYPKK